jgi:hypothetical protein
MEMMGGYCASDVELWGSSSIANQCSEWQQEIKNNNKILTHRPFEDCIATCLVVVTNNNGFQFYVWSYYHLLLQSLLITYNNS